jgi:hypothetical protein
VPALTAYQALGKAIGPHAEDDRLLVLGAGAVTGRLVVERALGRSGGRHGWTEER